MHQRRSGLKKIAIIVIGLLFIYLSLFTWNLRTGVLDRLAGHTGLEVTSQALRPGRWVADTVEGAWSRYVHLVGAEAENELLREALMAMTMNVTRLKEEARKVRRLEALLDFSPRPGWERAAARVITHRMGPAGELETVMVDKGTRAGVRVDDPVAAPAGLVGRVMKASLHASNVLLLTDLNSRVPVIGADSRTTGVLAGQGPGKTPVVLYIPRNNPLEQGEVFVTSGLGSIFPKGVPVARAETIEVSDISLFKTVTAEPVIRTRDLEEVFMLRRAAPAGPGGQTGPGEDG
jgi:rod shape-determining protein MreC